MLVMSCLIEGLDMAENNSLEPPAPVLRVRRRYKSKARVPLVLASSAAACIFLIADSSLKCAEELRRLWARSVDAEPHYGSGLYIVGILCVTFTLRHVAQQVRDEIDDAVQRYSTRK